MKDAAEKAAKAEQKDAKGETIKKQKKSIS